MSGGRFHLDRVSRLHAVADPVRCASVNDALHGHARRFIEERTTRERIASEQMSPLVRNSKGQELAGAVTKSLGSGGWNFEDERLGIVRFLDNLADPERIVSFIVRLISHYSVQYALLIRICAPLMKRDSSEMRNSTSFATSFASQKRDAGSAS